MLFSGGGSFFLALSAAGQAKGGPSVHYRTRVGISVELRGGVLSIQHRLTRSFFQGVAIRLAEPLRCEWKPPQKRQHLFALLKRTG